MKRKYEKPEVIVTSLKGTDNITTLSVATAQEFDVAKGSFSSNFISNY